MLIVALDGPAHSGRSDLATALLRLCGFAGGFDPVEAHAAIAAATTKRLGTPTTRAAAEEWASLYRDRAHRADTYERLVCDHARLGWPLLVIEGTDAGTALPDRADWGWCDSRRVARLVNADGALTSSEHRPLLRPWLSLLHEQQESELGLISAYLAHRDLVEFNVVSKPRAGRLPVPEGARRLLPPPCMSADGSHTLLEDLAAVGWLAALRGALDDAHVPHADLDSLPDYDEGNPLSDPEAARHAAEALAAEALRVLHAAAPTRRRAVEAARAAAAAIGRVAV